MKVLFSKETKLEDALIQVGSMFETAAGDQYFYLPYWFQMTDKGVLSQRLGDLPKDLVDHINTSRDAKSQ